jgi:hypothetical protein
MEDDAVKALADLGPDDELIALVYLGWPVADTPVVPRPEPAVVHVS